MRISIDLNTAQLHALRRYAHSTGFSLEDAAQAALHDWLMGRGFMDLSFQMNEKTESVGED